MSTPPLSPRQIALGLLQPDEEILWEGKPRHCFFVHRWDVWLTLIWGLFCLSMSVSILISYGSFLYFVLFFILALLFCIIPNVLRYTKLRKSHYLITDQRLVLVTGGNLEFWEYRNIPYLERSQKRLGVTTLYLQPMGDVAESIHYRATLYQVLFWFLFPTERRTLWETGRGALVNLSDEDIDRASSIIERQLYSKKKS